MAVLVTGGAGFIGSNYVRHLLETTEEAVTVLDALTYAGARDRLAAVDDRSRLTVVEGDVRTASLVADCLSTVDSVVHFAAETHVDRSIRDARPFAETNVVGTQTLLDAARETDLDRFVQISTDEVYGEVPTGRVTETAALAPRNPYAATKASADLLARSARITHGIPVSTVRPVNTFGPRQHAEKVVPTFVRRALAGDPLPVYGDGTHVREWLYVADACRAIECVRQSGAVGTTYNVSSHVERTTLELARAILAALDRPTDLIDHVEDRPGHDRRYALATDRIEALGWTPRVSFEEGLERTIDYYS